jgi:hypothetical protein
MTLTDAGSSIPASCVQEVLESASNSADKGVSEFSTPLALGKILRIPLPQSIEVLTDLTGGRGQLIAGVADGTTRHGLICEIQPTTSVKADRPAYAPLEWSRITGDLCLVYDLLKMADWQGDCFVLNPPWSLHWYKERLSQLSQSDWPTVTKCYHAIDPQVGWNKIDSTIGTWLMAMDRCTQRGEGFVIANESTLERLVFGHNAPYRGLRQHVWLRVVLDGNPMTESDTDAWGNEAQTGIVYWAKDHYTGPQMTLWDIKTLAQLEQQLKVVPDCRFRLREGLSMVYSHYGHQGTVKTWEAVREEWMARRKSKRTDFNIWLENGDQICCQLSRFDEVTASVCKRDAKALFELHNQTAMGLVCQVATRQALQRAVNGTTWRVSPDVPAMVEKCIAEYQAVRAPIVPLSDTMRIGYIDETDMIVCKKDMRK